MSEEAAVPRSTVKPGQFFFHRIDDGRPSDPFLAVEVDDLITAASKIECITSDDQDRPLCIDLVGRLRWTISNQPCFITENGNTGKDPWADRGTYWNAFHKRYDEKLKKLGIVPPEKIAETQQPPDVRPRHQVKSGQFFKHPGQDEVFLAIERNTDTVWYAVQQPSTFVQQPLLGLLFCLDSRGRFLNTSMDSPCIIQSFTPALSDLKHQLVISFVEKMRIRAKEMNVNLLQQPFVPYKFGDERPDLKDLPSKMTEALKQRHDDAVDRLYQDQRDYLKREEERAKQLVAKRENTEKERVAHVMDTNRQSDEMMTVKRQDLKLRAHTNIHNVFVAVREVSFSIHQLDRHGWGEATKEERQEYHNAHAELKAFVEQWAKKHDKIITWK